MNDIEFAQACADYKTAEATLAGLRIAIQTEVLIRKATQEVAGVKASYYKSSTSYDYREACKACVVPENVIEAHTTIVRTTRWKEVAEEVGADLTNFATEEPARVVIR